MKTGIKGRIKAIFASCGRFFASLNENIRALISRSPALMRFFYVILPVRTKAALSFLKRHRLKIIIPTAVCAALLAALIASSPKNTENSDYYTTGDDTADFGMVLQHYSTFDHSEKTHIAVALSWDDGALNLANGMVSSRIKAKVFPVNLENPDIEWSSSDEEIAAVDENGKISATKPGRVNITASLVNYNRAAKARLSIKQPVSGLFLPTTTMTLYMGGSAQYLSARIFPENASNKNIKWESKNTKVARVDNNGTVKPVGIGVTEITAETEDGGYEGKCFVTVVNPSVDVKEITLQNADAMKLKVGDNVNAVVTVSPSNARNKTLRWSSEDIGIASVSQTGRIRGTGEGTTNITAESVNGIKQTFAVEVAASDERDPFILSEEEENVPAMANGTVTYTPYDVTFPQAVRIQMEQKPPPKLWTPNGSIYATEAQAAERMNPNSYYEGAYKYQFLDLSQPNGLNADVINSYLSDKGILRGQGQAFVDAANENNVSEIYLIVHACLETGNGTSTLSKGVEVNGTIVYNMFGIGAYDNSAVSSGSKRAYDEGWTSVEGAIKGGARWISEHYINSADTRQNTLYKMLWNPERPGYHQYATDAEWAIKQSLNIDKIFESFPDAVRSYDVPVYSGQIPPTITAD